jgi:hypothetical protein
MRTVIDGATGEVALDSGASIGPGLTLKAFLVSPLVGRASPPAPGGTSWSNFGLRNPEMGGQKFGVGLGFEGEALRTVDLSMVQSTEPLSRDDWSQDRELARKARHDTWLHAQLGYLPWSFSWGEVSSDYDPRGGSSGIRIAYYGPTSAIPRWRGPHVADVRTVTIGAATGEIALDTGERIGPALTRSAFLAHSRAGGAAQPNPSIPHLSTLPLELRLPGARSLSVKLDFDGEALRRIALSMTGDHDPPVADYRQHWTDDVALASLVRTNEIARKGVQDAWLEARLGPPPWSYSWGRVGSRYDATFVRSLITVAYS